MTASPFIPALFEDETETTPMPQALASHIEALRQRRIEDLADQIAHPQRGYSRSELERNVDEMLDALTTEHRLEQLAAYVARGGHISVDADRLLIAQNAETFTRMLEMFSTERPSSALASSGLMPSYPMPID